MKPTAIQAELMREAGIVMPDDISNYEYTAEDEELLADLLMDSLAPGQEMTKKAIEIRNLLDELEEA